MTYPTPKIAEMAMLIRQLLRHVPENKEIHRRAKGYLQCFGLQGSTLREEERDFSSVEWRAANLTDAELAAELRRCAEQFAGRDEGGGGSPGEQWAERAMEIETEQRRRSSPTPSEIGWRQRQGGSE